MQKDLETLPKQVQAKIKKLQFADQFVVTNQDHGYVTEAKTGKEVLFKDWRFTMKDLAKILHVTLPWLYANLRGNVHYVYISKFNLPALSFFYQTPMEQLHKYRELSSVHLNSEDVFKWFNSYFDCGVRSVVIDAERIFGDSTDEATYLLAMGLLRRQKNVWDTAQKYVKDPELWDLCTNAPDFRYTSKYPLVKKPSFIKDAYSLGETDFHALSEYKYASTGLADMLSRGSYVFKAKTGRNGKMLFVFRGHPAFDEDKLASRVNSALEKSSYKQWQVDQALQGVANLFAVPAVDYFAKYPAEK